MPRPGRNRLLTSRKKNAITMTQSKELTMNNVLASSQRVNIWDAILPCPDPAPAPFQPGLSRQWHPRMLLGSRFAGSETTYRPALRKADSTPRIPRGLPSGDEDGVRRKGIKMIIPLWCTINADDTIALGICKF